MRRALSATPRFALACLAALLAQSVFWSPNAPVAFSAGAVALTAVSWWRPAWGLIALAVLAPLGRLIANAWLNGYPIRGAEALTLAFLAGVSVRSVARRADSPMLPSRVTGPWLLFVTSVLASAAVLWRYSQFHNDYPGAFLGRLAGHLATGFHGPPGDPRLWMETAGFAYVNAAVLVVAGVAVMLIAARSCAIAPGLARRIVIASVVTGAGISVLSVTTVLEAAVATGRVLDALPELVVTGRWAVHVNKVNTAGSYFVMVAVLAAGLVATEPERRARWVVALALSASALWLTASLAAILAGVAVLVAVIVYQILTAGGGRRSVVRSAGVLLLLVTVLVVARTGTRPKAMESLALRWAITNVSLDTAAESPVFGVGIGTYAQRSLPHQTDVVKRGFGEAGIQPHNYVLQILAELGLVGLGLFVWALVGTLRLAVGAHRSAAGAWAVPAALATVAFLISALSGQPMLVDSVAIPAWIVMGLIIAAAPLTTARALPARWVLAGVALIGLTVPFRMASEIRGVDPRRIGHGTTTAGDASGLILHYLDGPARLFVHSSAAAIRVSAEAPRIARTGELFLSLAAPGVTTGPLPLVPGARRTVCLDVAPEAVGGHGFRTIAVSAVTASGGAAPPGSVWAAVEGLDRTCGTSGR